MNLMKRYIIERDIPRHWAFETELREAARASNQALATTRCNQWQHSYVAWNKTFCVSGVAAIKVRRTAEFHDTEVAQIIDPTTVLISGAIPCKY
jgi:hypothetical protein